jgi:hypothetical protein
MPVLSNQWLIARDLLLEVKLNVPPAFRVEALKHLLETHNGGASGSSGTGRMP